jgi:hypothetical protein
MLNELLKVHEAFRLERRRDNGTGIAAPDHVRSRRGSISLDQLRRSASSPVLFNTIG